VSRSIAEQLERLSLIAAHETINVQDHAGWGKESEYVSGRLAALNCPPPVDASGRVPLHTIRADVDYGISEAHIPWEDWE
jgi:ribosomal protein S3